MDAAVSLECTQYLVHVVAKGYEMHADKVPPMVGSVVKGGPPVTRVHVFEEVWKPLEEALDHKEVALRDCLAETY